MNSSRSFFLLFSIMNQTACVFLRFFLTNEWKQYPSNAQNFISEDLISEFEAFLGSPHNLIRDSAAMVVGRILVCLGISKVHSHINRLKEALLNTNLLKKDGILKVIKEVRR
eukprot:TRINITY_DN3592_c0_g2_i1.p1 TRINITY_DN3592_c0_g2~~TRINITY_DN3592_c0_g2_i1.p1  ORF type:complete len:112 (-),score=22.35 TRINITY_DN3592_c0_g2_i1:64-399(-)